jgi:peroxiredoxin Q/BCP
VEKKNAVVLGISGDPVEKQAKFATKYGLPFTLLADVDHKVAKAYGAWGKKNMYGKTYEGIIRSTFLIDPHGKVAQEWLKVKVDGHEKAVLEAINI